MTDGTRILRTVGIPLTVALVFLFLVPRTCQKALGSKKLRPAAAPAAPTDTALHISSDNPDAPRSGPVAWPAGLDAQKAQYLIEIDQRFTEPYKIILAKPGGMVIDPAVGDALVRAGFFEESGGGYNAAPGASLHLPGMTESSVAWIIPAAKRKFERVTQVESAGDGKAKVHFTWTWEPNEAGRAVRTPFDLHEGTADFAGGGEHPWDLNSVSVDFAWR